VVLQIKLKDVVLEIPKEVLEPIETYLSQTGFGFESGGILLGSKVEHEERLIVTEMTLPSPKDESGPFTFVRNAEPANKLISQAWEASDGITNYLGEWHTHNEKIPHPSFVDENLMRQVVEEKSCLFNHAFMIIIGNTGQAFVGMVDTKQSGDFSDCKIIHLSCGSAAKSKGAHSQKPLGRPVL
jgi:integrative and conjugative element protein (TIGR02256 family)